MCKLIALILWGLACSAAVIARAQETGLPAAMRVAPSALTDPYGFHTPVALPYLQGHPLAPVGVLNTQFGTLHLPPNHNVDVPLVSPLAGHFRFGLNAGTHTVDLFGQAGAAGVANFGPGLVGQSEELGNLAIAYRGRASSRVASTQWSYSFPGVESQFDLELVAEFPALAWPLFETGWFQWSRFGIGYRLDWFENASFDKISGEPIDATNDHSVLDQRLANLVLQFDFATRSDVLAYQRLRFEFGNDSILGADGGDQFRTAQIRFLYLRQSVDWQFRCGILLDFFTGEVDESKVFITPEGTFHDTTGLAFSNRSQGFLGLQLGGSRFHQRGPVRCELGVDVTLGPDTEEFRDDLQNKLIHEWLLDTPQIPLVARGDRFKFDVRLYYTLHF